MALQLLHPIVSAWFKEKFGLPSEPQKLGWPVIAKNQNTLIAAPTGSGKTLSAFMICIDRLVREALAGKLENRCKIVYISPLKALASDVRKNLEIPLAEIQARFATEGFKIPPIRSVVRTGDTPQSERQKILRTPPHILVTTPESLYLVLTSDKGRNILADVETIIVDEIHALARDKRGSHLSLSLERLKALTKKTPTLIGLSATQKPIAEIAHFLVGAKTKNSQTCKIIDVGHTRPLDLDLIVPPSPLSTVCSHEQWNEIYQLLAAQIEQHRSTLIFVNTRRLAERVAFRLAEILGDDQVLSHHGSLSRDRRLATEERLKTGNLKAIVATASLELGIDIGYIDLVCQIGSPYSIATFLQRIGRSGHAIKAVPKGRLVPLSRDELVESLALIRAVKTRELDKIEIPIAPLDILTQHIIAECAGRGVGQTAAVKDIFKLFKHAWPYRDLSFEVFMRVVQMAADGYTDGQRRRAFIVWDRAQNKISARAGARIAALTSGGAIPETGDYRVVLAEDGAMVGTVNEDFAIESLAGDVFILGTHSWRVKHVRNGEVVVHDAAGQAPTVPFWLGEAPGRTKEFSTAVDNLRQEIGERLGHNELNDSQFLKLEALPQIRELRHRPFDKVIEWLQQTLGLGDRWPLLQVVHYLAVEKFSLGLIPSQKAVVFERFFDEMAGMQLVIHSPYGARINRAWGLALRKRFCRSFDFELQASADDDGIVLSVGPQNSFPIEQLFTMLTPQNVEPVLVQALLAAPMFGARWRWNATRALAVLRFSSGKRLAPQIQRFRSEDLLAKVFPQQTACQENRPGDIEIPDHPLVQQTIHDCLTEAMDIEGLKKLLADVKRGAVKLIAKDTREPSPFTYQLLNAYPYAFLDDAPLEERRTRAVATRFSFSINELQELDRLDPKAIAKVEEEAWPHPQSKEELYEIFVAAGAFPKSKAKEWNTYIEELTEEGRVVSATVSVNKVNRHYYVALENIPLMNAAYPNVQFKELPDLPTWLAPPPEKEIALQKILSGWLEIRGPITNEEISQLFSLENADIYLTAIETRGDILRCKVSPRSEVYTHWCARRILRRIHRLTVEGLREQIRPAAVDDFLEFLFAEHGLNLNASASNERPVGKDGLISVITRLQGFEAPAMAWESELLAGRVAAYDPADLDQLTAAGVVAFARLTEKNPDRLRLSGQSQKLTKVMPLSFVLRRNWSWIVADNKGLADQKKHPLSSNAQIVFETLRQAGALFFDEIISRTGLLTTQVEVALGELAAEGLSSCDQFSALRNLLSPLKRDRKISMRGLPNKLVNFGQGLKAATGGRWSLLHKGVVEQNKWEDYLENWAWLLLARYGIIFRDLLARENLAPTWGQLVGIYRRLEARGEIRGGRFIQGVSGEQFGTMESYQKLLQVREERAQGKRADSYAVISSADPLNLVGIITKEERIPVSHLTRILFVNGSLSAVCRDRKIEPVKPISNAMTKDLMLIGSFRGRHINANI